ncbi:hypothetical protein GCM10009634_23110 [Saccharothrix xinjiangensis]
MPTATPAILRPSWGRLGRLTQKSFNVSSTLAALMFPLTVRSLLDGGAPAHPGPTLNPTWGGTLMTAPHPRVTLER